MRKSFQDIAKYSEAEKALKLWGIRYKKKKDGSLLVRGDINISNRGLTRLPDLSRVFIVRGSFNCSDNLLTSLEGAPQQAIFHFNCSRNRLTSLKGAPAFIGHSFWCSGNLLTTLEGAPRSLSGDFFCHENPLTSLEHAPKQYIETGHRIHSDWGVFPYLDVPEYLLKTPEPPAPPKKRGFNL